MFDIKDLIVTQECLRDINQLPKMIDHVKNGGLWTKDVITSWSHRKVPLIALSVFEDGKTFLHDGHHRLVSTWLAGRKILDPAEYEIKEWKYSEYLEINFAEGWVTPFDPRIELRLADFFNFKKEVLGVLYAKGLTAAEEYIKSNKHLYTKKRKIFTVDELSLAYNDSILLCKGDK